MKLGQHRLRRGCIEGKPLSLYGSGRKEVTSGAEHGRFAALEMSHRRHRIDPILARAAAQREALHSKACPPSKPLVRAPTGEPPSHAIPTWHVAQLIFIFG